VVFNISAGAKIYGTVYCAGKVETRGKVFGTLYCDRFFLQTRQGYYENHLLDAWIDPKGLEPEFTSGIFMETTGPNSMNRIIEWLE
jgi:hypothetical protein